MGFFDIELYKLFTYFERGVKKSVISSKFRLLTWSFIKAEKPHLLEEIVYFDSDGFRLKLFPYFPNTYRSIPA